MGTCDEKTSSYFERTLFYDPSPATDQYFEQRVDSLFVGEKEGSSIEVYSQSSSIENKTVAAVSRLEEQDLSWINYPSDSDTSDSEYERDPPIAPDQYKYRRKNPPPYFDNRGLKLRNIYDRQALRSFIQNSKTDFRIFIIRQRNSYSRLAISRELFETLLSKCHILPRFKEFVLCFGVKAGENEVGPPQLKFRRLFVHPDERAFKGFECAYGLRFVELNNRGDGKDPWSSRQTVVYHKLKSNSKASTWILVTPSRTAELRLDRYVKTCQSLSAMNPFEIHLILLDTALANWRPYMVALTELVNTLADRVVLASVDGKGLIQVVEFEERQKLKQVEDKILDVKTVLDSTLDTVSSLIEKYTDLSRLEVSHRGINAELEHDSIVFGLQEKCREVVLTRKKVDVLHAKIQGTMKLLSGLLDLGNGLALKDLAVEAKRENEAMRHLTEKGTRDAAALKVLTIITLIYLPATVVSNFYSTSFITTETKGNSTKLVYLDNVWLFFAITIPLTLGTLAIWWIMVQIQAFMTSKKEERRRALMALLHRREKSDMVKEERLRV